MEEDIKILENYIDEREGALKIWQIETLNECEDLREAIEHLIARNKELENKLKSLIEIIKINKKLYDKETKRLGNIIGELLED